MDFRRWFDRQRPEWKALTTIGLTFLAWALVGVIGLGSAALMGYAWWR